MVGTVGIELCPNVYAWPPSSFHIRRKIMELHWCERVIGDKNQISEDVFDFMISYLPFPQKSIGSELAKLFSISIFIVENPRDHWTRRS